MAGLNSGLVTDESCHAGERVHKREREMGVAVIGVCLGELERSVNRTTPACAHECCLPGNSQIPRMQVVNNLFSSGILALSINTPCAASSADRCSALFFKLPLPVSALGVVSESA